MSVIEHDTLTIDVEINGGAYRVTAHRYTQPGWGDQTVINVHTVSDDPAMDGLPAISTVRIDRLLGDDDALRVFVAGYRWLDRPRELMWHTVRGVEWTPLVEPDGPVRIERGTRIDWDRPFTATVTTASGGAYTVVWRPEGTSTITDPRGVRLRLQKRPGIEPGRKIQYTTEPAVAGGYLESRFTGAVVTRVSLDSA